MSKLLEDINQMNEMAYSPDFWKRKSEDYFLASKVIDFSRKNPIPAEMKIDHQYLSQSILISPGMISVVHYLMGSSLELLLKALCIKKGYDYRKLDSHNLVELAKNAQIQIDSNEGKTFKFLTEAIYNYGKYPNVSVPEKIEVGFHDPEKTERNEYFETKYVNSVHIEIYEILYKKIMSIYHATSYKDWKRQYD